MTDDAVNELELLLMRAVNDQAERPAFYSKLLESDVFIIGYTDAEPEGGVFREGEKLSVMHWQKQDGTSFIPFFSSLETLRAALDSEQPYVVLPARTLFKKVKGVSLILNPASNFGKEFFPNEIEALLETGLNHAPQHRVVEESTEVLLGQPAEYPTAMVDALTRLLAKHSEVKAAYLCLKHDPSQPSPSLVVGLDGEDVERAMQEAGLVAAETAPPGMPVDFTRVTPDDAGLGAYFRASVDPFYERS